MKPEPLTWKFVDYSVISADDLYDAMVLRQRVFIVEQRCAFLDMDGVDRYSWHLLCRDKSMALVAYARIVPPGRRFDEPSIGRVVTAPEVRRTGLGRMLMEEAIRLTKEMYPGLPIKLSAQRYLENFYGSLGFVVTGEPYEEDGIPHINMVKSEF
jgi:ElaA protein